MKLYRASKTIHAYFFSCEEDHCGLSIDGAGAIDSEVQMYGVDSSGIIIRELTPIDCKSIDHSITPWGQLCKSDKNEELTIGKWIKQETE